VEFPGSRSAAKSQHLVSNKNDIVTVVADP
jgi:hypothetical protein